MGIETLFTDPLAFLMFAVVILASLSFHEFAHALAGLLQGDETAKNMGRLTLDPRAHVDPLGLIALLTVGFGWGKPVPFNPYNLKNQRWGPVLVAFAGPLANVVLLTMAGLSLKALTVLTSISQDNAVYAFLSMIMLINASLFLFNLIPIPPLDGSKLLFSILDHPKYYRLRVYLETRGPIILLMFIAADALIFGGRIFGTLFGGLLNIIAKIFGL